ncbi:MAG TPA: hypothetical protein VFV37_06285 [Luteibaculaceae bacterium]|nr:hypothetical protein [Luteibaculaceae bacterium]
MLTLFGIGKRKISENKVANVLVNTLIEYCENGFPEVVEVINNSPEFSSSPNVDKEQYAEFLQILIVSNLNFLPHYLEPDIAARVQELVIEKFAGVFEVNPKELDDRLKEYKKFLTRINHPSKNMLYAMSKGMFYKYDLNDYQNEEYFRNLQTPNPIFLKRLDDVMAQFIFNWDDFVAKYRVTAQ